MSSDASTPVEGEEEEEEKKSGRSAFFAGVHRADSFSGSYRGVPSTPHGGAQNVKPEDTIGTPDCWCGQPYGHSWPGKEAGRKHPREEGTTTMSTATRNDEHLAAKVLNQFDKRVSRMLQGLVNSYGVGFRMPDGGHILLYSADGTRPFKVSASRQAEQTLEFLENWARDHVAPTLTATAADALAAHFNDPTKRRVRKSSAVQAAPEPTPEPEAPEVPTSPGSDPSPVDPNGTEPVPLSVEPPEGYERWYSMKDGTDGKATARELNWWKEIGVDRWICKSCGYAVTGTLQHKGAHQRVHNSTPEERAVTARAGGTSPKRDAERDGKRMRARNAIRFLAEEYDVDLGVKQVDTTGYEKKIARLEENLDKVTKERDDLKARLDLMREAMRA